MTHAVRSTASGPYLWDVLLRRIDEWTAKVNGQLSVAHVPGNCATYLPVAHPTANRVTGPSPAAGSTSPSAQRSSR